MKSILGMLLIFLVVGSGCSSAGTPPALPTFLSPVVLATPADGSGSYPTLQASESTSVQTVGGFDVTLQRAWRDGKRVSADVCFTRPDNSDWTVWDAHLEFGGGVISEFSSSLLSSEDGVNGQQGRRCDEIAFYVAPDADLTSAALRIESLGVYPTPDEYCSLYMPKIQQALTERGIAITLGCTDTNGTTSMQILTRPDGMTDEEAQQIVFSDEFYTVTGPWIFSFNLGR